MERWRELVIDREKWRGNVRQAKPTAGCRASGRRRITFFTKILPFVRYSRKRPVVTYGAETWTMTKKEEQDLLIFESKIFRTIYGPKYEDGEWKSRTNWEVEKLNKGENIVKWIKEQRISWLGHLERMEEDMMPKKIFTRELKGMRRRGRPRKG
jgi:hypothetical protein